MAIATARRRERRLAMWCVRCDNDVVGCRCGDIEQRLDQLIRRDSVIAPAARANLRLRLLLAKGAGKAPH